MIGEALGNYTITAKLGSGAMGVVFRAEHVRIARTAAIKVLVPELAENATAVQRFFNEARATSSIRHPGIVDVFDCAVDATGRAYIVMENLDGETLAERLAPDREHPVGAGLRDRAAGRGGDRGGARERHRPPRSQAGERVPRRDPRTRGGGSVKVLDFGIAKLLAADASARLTMRGVALGTPEYMAPEQCAGRGGDRRARGHLRARLHPVRDAERRAAVHGRVGARAVRPAHVPRGSRDRRAAARAAGMAGRPGDHHARQEARRTAEVDARGYPGAGGRNDGGAGRRAVRDVTMGRSRGGRPGRGRGCNHRRVGAGGRGVERRAARADFRPRGAPARGGGVGRARRTSRRETAFAPPRAIVVPAAPAAPIPPAGAEPAARQPARAGERPGRPARSARPSAAKPKHVGNTDGIVDL